MACSHCGGNNIIDEVPLVTGRGGGAAYVDYKKKKEDWLPKREKVYAAVCQDCGTLRMYAKKT